MATPDSIAATQSSIQVAESQQNAEIQERVLANLDNLKDVSQNDLTSFFKSASDEQLNQFYEGVGIDIKNFYDVIEQRVADYVTPFDGKALKEDPSYSSAVTIQAIEAEYKDEVLDIVEAWVLTSREEGVAPRFNEFASTEPSNTQIQTKIVEDLIRERDLVQAALAFFGLEREDNPSASNAISRIKDIVDWRSRT